MIDPAPTASLSMRIIRAAALAVLAASPVAAQSRATDSTATSWSYDSENARFIAEVVATGLKAPVSFAFLPDGLMLAADRPTGQLLLVDLGTGVMTPVLGVPPVHGKVDGGLLEVVVHPDYQRNGWIYIAYASEDSAGNGLVVFRAHLHAGVLEDRQDLFAAQPRIANSNEFGARLVLDSGYLYVSVGQRDTPLLAQDLGSDLGKIIRLYDNGHVPRDNPFTGRKGARPEIWAYGVRNPVGLAVNPWTGALWEHEHGPRGGDEVNIIQRGKNYGWPVIGYGIEYDGKLVGDGITHAAGMEQPIYYWVPDIAPTGMIFYTGKAFPGWRSSAFIGALVRGRLVRLAVDGGRVLHEERLMEDRPWKVRAVQQGPDGFLYLGVIGSEGGMIIRIRPLEGGNAHPR
jgi:glucose/arabinose dehydrogenase